jgi:arabinose-5-phosphate isomerase
MARGFDEPGRMNRIEGAILPAALEMLHTRSSFLPGTSMNGDKIKALGEAVLRTEAEAIVDLADRVDDSLVEACRHLLACEGRIIVLGMGKSGHIGGKIAATFASTGSPAFFVHPGEASHGDLGMITNKDAVLAISNSGETDEILTILPIIKRLGAPLIVLTGNLHSTLARAATVVLDVSVRKEACPLGLAPTSSTTATLAMGDALAISLLETRGFTADDFARSHPAGRLGRRLLLHVADVMRVGEQIPSNAPHTPLAEVLVEMSGKGMGFTAIVDETKRVLGVFTDGDLRRALDSDIQVRSTPVCEIMTRPCTTIEPGVLAAEALNIMESRRINALPVVDRDGTLVGALNMHDMLRSGVA